MMKQEILFKKLGNILNELNDQYQYLSQNPEQLSELELELFLANASFLTDHIRIVKKLNLPLHVPIVERTEAKEVSEAKSYTEEVVETEQAEMASEADLEEILTPILEEEILPEEPVEEQFEGVPFELEAESTQTFEFVLNKNEFAADDKFDFEEKNANELFDRSLTDEEELILERMKQPSVDGGADLVEEDEIGPEPFLVRKEQAPEPEAIVEIVPELETPKPVETTKVTIETTKVELETTHRPTLNDILSQKNGGTRVNETSAAELSDLKSAINLNDKLLYIKDLFNGYSLAYAEAIDIANKMANFDAADNFLQKNYAIKNNWAEHQATVDKFYILLNRRFKI